MKVGGKRRLTIPPQQGWVFINTYWCLHLYITRLLLVCDKRITRYIMVSMVLYCTIRVHGSVEKEVKNGLCDSMVSFNFQPGYYSYFNITKFILSTCRSILLRLFVSWTICLTRQDIQCLTKTYIPQRFFPSPSKLNRMNVDTLTGNIICVWKDINFQF